MTVLVMVCVCVRGVVWCSVRECVCVCVCAAVLLVTDKTFSAVPNQLVSTDVKSTTLLGLFWGWGGVGVVSLPNSIFYVFIPPLPQNINQLGGVCVFIPLFSALYQCTSLGSPACSANVCFIVDFLLIFAQKAHFVYLPYKRIIWQPSLHHTI